MSSSLSSLSRAAPPLPVQLAEFDGVRLFVPSDVEYAFALPEASPDFARAYMLAATRRPGALHIDLTVVLEGSTVVVFGPPTCWQPDVAQKVDRGEFRVGVLRVFRTASARARMKKERAATAEAGAGGGAVGAEATAASGAGAGSPTRPLMRRLSGSLTKILARTLKSGTSSDAGGCAHMEDAHMVHVAPDAEYAFCGVFDGHGGTHAAHFCRDNLHLNVMATSSFCAGEPRAALRDGFRKTESDLLFEQRRSRTALHAEERASGACCGCTALLMLMQSETLHVAWLGDCRAILCRAGGAFALTKDHSLDDPAERARALKDGGNVEGNRLGGFLEVARALGDFDHAQGCKPAGLSALPELRSEPLTPEDEFVILGSDGLWGVVRPDDAVRLARAELQAYDGDATMASEKLVEVANKRHADDNITAMVVLLNFAAAKAVQSADTPRRPRLALLKRSSPALVQSSSSPVPAAAVAATGAGGAGGPRVSQSDMERTSNSSSSSSVAPSSVSASERPSATSARSSCDQ